MTRANPSVEHARGWGALSGMLIMVAAFGGNWLITPMAHPDAGRLRTYGVIAQVLACTAAAIWSWTRATKSPDPAAKKGA